MILRQTVTSVVGRVIPFLYIQPDTVVADKKYPVILFLHGQGERTVVMNSDANLGILESVDTHREFLRGAQADHNGERFIVYMPQLFTGDGNWQNWYVEEMLAMIRKNPSADLNRLYITGLSLGGGGVLNYITKSATVDFAAAITCCGTTGGATNYCNVSTKKLPVAFYHAKDDTTVGYGNSKGAMEAINSCAGNTIKAVGKWATTGGHAVWNTFYKIDGDPFLNGVTVWEFMLMNTLDKPVAMPTPGLDASEQPAKAVAKYADLNPTTGTVTLDATESINVAGAYNYWEVTGKPAGASWDILTKKDTLLTTAKNLIPGVWKFTFNSLKGTTIQTSASVEFTVVGVPPPPPPSKIVIATVRVYSDGSIEKV